MKILSEKHFIYEMIIVFERNGLYNVDKFCKVMKQYEVTYINFQINN